MPISVSRLQHEPPPSPEEQWRVVRELLVRQLEEKNKDVYKWRNLLTHPGIFEERAAIADLKQSDPTNFQQIAATQLDLANSYYTSVRNQSAQSFLWSRVTSGVGFVFFLIIELGNVSYFGAAVSVVGGVIVEVYAGLVQWQGKLTADQAKDYHVRLDRIQRFIVANSACEGLDGAEKQQKRSEIISKLVE